MMRRLLFIAREGYLSPRALGWMRGWLAASLMRGLPPAFLYPQLVDDEHDALSIEWPWKRGGWCPSFVVYLNRPERPATYVHLFDDADPDLGFSVDVCLDAEPDLTGPVTTRLIALVRGALAPEVQP